MDRLSDEERLERRRRSAREWQRRNRALNIEKRKEYMRGPDGRYFNYKFSAKKMGRVWELSKETAFAFFRSSCHYCGVPPNPLNGIDRKDNGQGYIEINCLPCCSVCNYAKRTMKYADFMAWVDRITMFRRATDLKLQLIAEAL